MALARAWSSSVALSSIVLGSTVALGCGEPAPIPPIDATFPDAAIVHPDAGPISDPCDDVMRVTGSLTEVTEVMLDTSMVETRPRDLGLTCGNVTAQYWARQQVIELTVPGTGMLALYVSTENMNTAMDFHTVVQLRTACATPPTGMETRPTCFDGGISAEDFRTDGGLMVRGGETLFVYVTGYSDPPAIDMTDDEGPVRVTFEFGPNTAPTLTGGLSVLTAANAIQIHVDGTDAERPPEFLGFGLMTARGGLDFNGDGALDYFGAGISRTVGTTPNFSAEAIVPAESGFGEICRMYTCTQLSLFLVDQASLQSATRSIPLVSGQFVASGATCDASHLCDLGLTCNAGVCGVVVASGEACDATRVCGAGQACSTTSMTCVDAAAIGESCASAPCDTGLDCDGTSMTCVMTVGVGVACDATHVCDSELTCSATTMLCEMVTP
jgi:hypothetical protein